MSLIDIMDKNKKKFPVWLQLLLVIVVSLFIGFWFSGGLSENKENNVYENVNEETKQDSTYEQVDSIWEQHREILDDDRSQILEIGRRCDEGVSDQDFKDCVNELNPFLEMYYLHLIEAKTFISQTGNTFSNRLGLQANLDEGIVYVLTVKNKVNQAVEDYNANLQLIQNQQEMTQAREQAIYDVLDVLGGIF